MIRTFFSRKNTSFERDSIILTISKIISGLVQIFVTMILSKYRSLQEYGTYTQMLLVINLVTSIIMLGLPNSVSFFLGRSKEHKERKDFLSVYFTLNTILTIVAGLVLVSSISLMKSYFHNDSIGLYWYFLAFFPWATVTSSAMENLAVSTQNTKILIPLKLFHSFLAISIALLCKFLNVSFQLYIVFYLICECTFAFCVYVLAAIVGKGIKPYFDWGLLKRIFSFSLPIGLAAAVGTLNAEIDKFMLGYFLTTEDVAIYANAAKELPITVVPISITAALLPRLSKLFKTETYSEGINLWGRGIILSLTIVSTFAFGCFVFSHDVIRFLYGDKYLSGDLIFKTFCILLIFRATYWGLILNTSGKTKFILYSSLISLLLNVALNFLMFKLWGMVGCAVASLLSTVLISFLQLFYTCKIIKISPLKIWPWKKIMIILFINFVFAIFFYRLKEISSIDLFVGSFFESLILGFIWAFLCFLVFIKFGLLAFRKGGKQ